MVESDTEESIESYSYMFQNYSSHFLFCCPLGNKGCEFACSVSPKEFLFHLKSVHSVTIKDPLSVIPYLQPYVEHYANTKTLDTGCVLGDDQDVRNTFQREKLAQALQAQEYERNSEHCLPDTCLFCPTSCNDRHEMFSHMFSSHGFNIGQLLNLVHVKEFISILKSKISAKQCVYCEKSFQSIYVLKKHMKTKGHFRIHSKNHLYDRFYISNYIEPGKNWESFNDNQRYDSSQEEEDWEGWDEPVIESTTCLFDSFVGDNPAAVLEHMRDQHGFDLIQLLSLKNMSFYSGIKLINYIRKRICDGKCINCDFCGNEGELLHHLEAENHLNLPNRDLFEQDMYLISTYADDPLLCGLDELIFLESSEFPDSLEIVA